MALVTLQLLLYSLASICSQLRAPILARRRLIVRRGGARSGNVDTIDHAEDVEDSGAEERRLC